ncbi:MAG: hypothetical protein V4702_06525 [Patescibacteria group bacterium]
MKFSSLEQIPDPISVDRLLPADRPDLWAPRFVEPGEALGITPLELSYVYLGDHDRKPGGSGHLESILVIAEPYDALKSVIMLLQNHTQRALSRVILHPYRRDLFDLPVVYDAEVERCARFAAPSERPFYEHFVETWGVLVRQK